MSGRNHRGPPIPLKGGPQQPSIHEPPYARAHSGIPPHPALLEEIREAHYSLSAPRQLPPHPAVIEERLASQHDDIQVLLIDNQRLAATHVALRQELEAAQHEIQRADSYARAQVADKELQMKELYDKSVKMEHELHVVNTMRSELMKVNMDVKELTGARQELNAQVHMMTQDLGRVNSDLHKVPAMKAEINSLKTEVERVRAAIEHEKKSFAESFEQGKGMENKLVTMAREMEKLRAELAANAEKRAHAAANPGVNYNAAIYSNSESAYPVNHPYYPMPSANPMHHPAPEGYYDASQYGGATWGAYVAQSQAQVPR